MFHCSSAGVCGKNREEMFMLRREVQVKGEGRKAPVLIGNPGAGKQMLLGESPSLPQVTKYCQPLIFTGH